MFLTLPWGRMAFEREGDAGPCLLFLHGTGCDNRDWAGVRFRLAPHPGRRVFMEFRGHGGSDVSATPFSIEDLATDTLALLAHLRAPKAVLVGHSLGGMVALAAARRQPAALAGLVLLEGWTSLKACGAFAPYRAFGGLDERAVAAVKAKSAATIARHRPDQWQAFWDTVRAFDASDVLATPPVPILEVYGERGRLPGTVDRLLVPEHPRIAWRWVPECGHYIPLEKPAETAALCLESAAWGG